MGRLVLVIADTDEQYLEALTGFLAVDYSRRFQILSFTNRNSLLNYLNENNKAADILLLAPEYYSDALPVGNIKAVILLSAEKNNCGRPDTVYKYQHGDLLAGDIIRKFSESTGDRYGVPGGGSRTRIVLFYSPSGGTGTTSIAVHTCINLAKTGLRVFYLNLENISSTNAYFKCENAHTLSNMIFYLKENSDSLNIKIEGIKSVDPHTNVHYFPPAESGLEIEEILPSEAGCLLEQFRLMSLYDMVIVDISSGFNQRTVSLMEASDDIILVYSQDDIPVLKTGKFFGELEKLSSIKGNSLNDKLHIVMNKYNGGTAAGNDNPGIGGMPASVIIPFQPEMASGGNAAAQDIDSGFASGIGRLVTLLNGQKTARQDFHSGL